MINKLFLYTMNPSSIFYSFSSSLLDLGSCLARVPVLLLTKNNMYKIKVNDASKNKQNKIYVIKITLHLT